MRTESHVVALGFNLIPIHLICYSEKSKSNTCLFVCLFVSDGTLFFFFFGDAIRE